MTSKDNPHLKIFHVTPPVWCFSLLLSKSSHSLSQTEDQRPKTEDAIGRSKQINIVLAVFTQIVTFSVFHTNYNQLGISNRIATNPLVLPNIAVPSLSHPKLPLTLDITQILQFPLFLTQILKLTLDITQILPFLDSFSSKIATRWWSKQRRVATLNFVNKVVLSPEINLYSHPKEVSNTR